MNTNFSKIQMPGVLPGEEMLKLQFDWYTSASFGLSPLQLRTVHGLLFAMGNTQHADSQRQAGIALEVGTIPQTRHSDCEQSEFCFMLRATVIVKII